MYMTKRILLLLLFVSAGVLAWAQPNYLQMGIRERDPEKKLEYFDKAVEQDNSDIAYILRGETYMNQGKVNAAIRDLRAAQEAKANSQFQLPKQIIPDYLARCYYRIGKYEECISNANQAYALKKDNLAVLEVRGLSYRALESYDLAKKDFRKMIEIDESLPYPHYYLSLTYYDLNDFEQALVEVEKAIKIEPGNEYYKERKGLILNRLGRIEEASEILLEGVEADQKSPRALFNLANVFKQNGDYETAIVYFDQAIGMHEELAKKEARYEQEHQEELYDIYIARGEANEFNKDSKAALRDYYEAKRIRDDHHLVYAKIGGLQSTERNFREAIEAYETCFKIKPDYTYGWVNLGFSYGELNKRKEAVRTYNRALRIDEISGKGLIYNNRGFSYLEMGDYDKAKKDLEQAIAEDPEIAMSHISLGEYYHEVKDYNKAIAKFDHALSMENRSDRETLVGYYKRGLSKLKAGDTQAAITDLMKSTRVELDKVEASVVESWETLGIAYFENDELCEARRALKKAVELNRATQFDDLKEAQTYLLKITKKDATPCN